MVGFQFEQSCNKDQRLQRSMSNRYKLKWCTNGYVPDYFLDRLLILPGFPALPVPIFAGSSQELLHAGIKVLPIFSSNSPVSNEKHFPKGQNVPRWARWTFQKMFFSHLFFLTFLGEISVKASKNFLQEGQFFALELWKASGHDGSRQF